MQSNQELLLYIRRKSTLVIKLCSFVNVDVSQPRGCSVAALQIAAAARYVEANLDAYIDYSSRESPTVKYCSSNGSLSLKLWII